MTDLAELMTRVTEDLEPDVTRIVAEGRSRGRSLRSRRRLAQGVAAMSVAGVIGAAAVVVPSHLFDASTLSAGAASGGAPTAAPAPTSSHPVVLPSPAALSERLGSLLPGGARHPLQHWGDGDFAAAAWSLEPTGSTGAGRVDVLVSRYGASTPGTKPTGADAKRLRPSSPSGEIDPQAACRDAGYHCVEVAGGWLDTSTGHEPASGGGLSPVISAHAELWTSDGLRVSATAYNAMGEKDEPVTRPAPVLDEAALAALAEQVGAKH